MSRRRHSITHLIYLKNGSGIWRETGPIKLMLREQWNGYVRQSDHSSLPGVVSFTVKRHIPCVSLSIRRVSQLGKRWQARGVCDMTIPYVWARLGRRVHWPPTV